MIAKTQIRIELTVEEFEQITKLAAKSNKSRNRFIIDSALNSIKPVEHVQELKTVQAIQTTKEQQKPAKQAKTWSSGYSKQDSAR